MSKTRHSMIDLKRQRDNDIVSLNYIDAVWRSPRLLSGMFKGCYSDNHALTNIDARQLLCFYNSGTMNDWLKSVPIKVIGLTTVGGLWDQFCPDAFIAYQTGSDLLDAKNWRKIPTPEDFLSIIQMALQKERRDYLNERERLSQAISISDQILDNFSSNEENQWTC